MLTEKIKSAGKAIDPNTDFGYSWYVEHKVWMGLLSIEWICDDHRENIQDSLATKHLPRWGENGS